MIEWILVIWIAVNGQIVGATKNEPTQEACVSTGTELLSGANAGEFLCIFEQTV